MEGMIYAGIKIIYPFTNRVIYFYNNIHIIGLVKRKSTIYIRVNNNPPLCVDSKEEIRFKTKDGIYYMFVKKIKLSYGLNYINIKSENFEENFYLECLKNLDYNQPKKKIYFHMNEKTFYCKKCHDFNNIKECKRCHIKFSKAKYIHGPVVTWQCFICHDKNNYFSPIQPIYIKCLKCHQEFSENMYNAKYAHAPALTGNCEICHTSHISKYKFFTNDVEDKICIKCHENKESKRHILNKKKSHKNISCVKCHNPHYGESKYLFINNINSRKKLCKECHK